VRARYPDTEGFVERDGIKVAYADTIAVMDAIGADRAVLAGICVSGGLSEAAYPRRCRASLAARSTCGSPCSPASRAARSSAARARSP
jgi:hypothetical protein